MNKPQMTASSEKNCYIKIDKYIVYIEVSEATENKPHVMIWKEFDDVDRVTTVKH
tara:strand:+ start:323 stop:487 length:165 start_codon:yes stop_codon:yes gene_type:complete